MPRTEHDPRPDAPTQLRLLLDAERRRVRSRVPRNAAAAATAVVHAGDRRFLDDAAARCPDTLGWTTALALCLDAGEGDPIPDDGLDAWVERFVRDCAHLDDAELVLRGCETGHLRLRQAGDAFDAWPATGGMPTEWREREDFAWWGGLLDQRVAPELAARAADRPGVRERLRALVADHDGPIPLTTGDAGVDGSYRRLGTLHVQRMAHQQGYPPDASIEGVTVGFYLDLIACLIGWALAEVDLAVGTEERGTLSAASLPPIPRHEAAVIDALAATLAAEPPLVQRGLQALTLDRENAGYHGAAPDAPAPPLICLGDEELMWSLRGLQTEPILFLMRELKRRHGAAYHNSAHLREGVFRQDLYRLFADKRFVTSPGSVALKREGGDLRTDLDALIFDRKTGTLGVFELKAQDPFARTAEERIKQRDNFFHANRQVAALLHWLKGNDATSLLARFDAATAKRFRVHRVHVFVLGRYLAHFAGGPAPDRRVAWGTWPQVLRLTGDRPVRSSDANPIGALFARLTKDTPLAKPTADQGRRDIAVGQTLIRVHPSFATLKEGEG